MPVLPSPLERSVTSVASAIGMRPIVLSFSGSGHLLCYQLGVATILLCPKRSKWSQRFKLFAGSSGGAIAASVCALLPRERVEEFAVSVACNGRSFDGVSEILRGEGPFAGASIGTVVQAISQSQQLFLSATHCRTGRNALFSRFQSPVELHRCILASASIPSSLHPFDLLRSRAPTYPEASGVIVDPACESDGGVAAARDAPPGLPFSPHGEAYVDGGISDTAPILPASLRVHALTVSPISGPRGRLTASTSGSERRAPDGAPLEHYHLCPEDDSPRVPWVAPRLAGMRCYLSRNNLQAMAAAGAGASPKKLEAWYGRGQSDPQRWLERWEPPPE